jgi:hypothetical protein
MCASRATHLRASIVLGSGPGGTQPRVPPSRGARRAAFVSRAADRADVILWVNTGRP